MQDLKWVVKEILDCGLMEVEMLLKTEIDIAGTVQYIKEEGLDLNMATLFTEAFRNKVTEEFDFNRIPGVNEDDFDIYYNGALDTHILLKGSKADFYREHFPEQLDEIETYMDMDFEETYA